MTQEITIERDFWLVIPQGDLSKNGGIRFGIWLVVLGTFMLVGFFPFRGEESSLNFRIFQRGGSTGDLH